MRRRNFVALLGGVVAAWPFAARAQLRGKIPRVGFMGNSTAALEANLIGPFREGLREHGYEEGRNVEIVFRWAEGSYERFPALIAELIACNRDRRHACHARGQDRDIDSACGDGGGRRSGRHRHRAEPGAARRQHHWAKRNRAGP